MYSIQALATLAGTTTRTLRHYDAIGLLVPARDPNGYRHYSSVDAERLQLILLYRALEVPLETIRHFLDTPSFDRAASLAHHVQALKARARYYETLAQTAETTLVALQGGNEMKDEALFKGMSYDEIRAHEATHETEVQERWGDEDAYETARSRARRRTKDETVQLNQQQVELIRPLLESFQAARPVSDRFVQDAVRANHQFIHVHFYPCSLEMFRELGKMYVADERFTAFYDRYAEGLAVYYNEAIQWYCTHNS